MPWGSIDDGLYDHPKLDALGKDRLAGVGLWTLCISWSNRYLTDGLVPSERIVRLGGSKALAEALVLAGLFDSTTSGYFIHDFLMFNKSRQQVEEERKRTRERVALHRAHTGRSNSVTTDAVRLPVPIRTVPTVPARAEPTVDTQKMTDEEQRAAYVAAQVTQTGVE